MRAAWREMGGAPYLASLRMDQAQSWDGVPRRLRLQPDSGREHGVGRLDRNIGYQAVGIAPQRPNWSGLVPVPGDGRYEWDGYLPIKALPHVLNPEKGFFNTSNNYLIPPGVALQRGAALHLGGPLSRAEGGTSFCARAGCSRCRT